MKLRTVKLTPEFLVQLLHGKSACASNLPSDAEILDVKMDLFSKQVLAVVRSDSFADIAENMPIPEFILTVKNEPKTTPKPVATTVTPTPISKPVVAKPALIPTSRVALSMENEFSPEQRKLLSFQTKGDVVIVKPVSFLKEEWEDINEVVRSLGGKWVKGDILSYWEIPLP